MNTLKTVSKFTGKYMSLIVAGVAALALFAPKTCLWINPNWINYLLTVVMLGMGLTLNLHDFKVVFTRPKDILIGTVAQFTLMPMIAFCIGKAFGLETGLLAGLILVGTCPGGTASNVMSYLAKGDVALSVGMTSVNTLLAPVLTPAITYLLLRTSVNVDVTSMMLSIVKVVVLPIALGFVLNHFFGEKTKKIVEVLPTFSVVAIAMIVATVVSHNSAMIFATGSIVFVVVILQNFFGYVLGYGVASLCGMPFEKRKTLAIEVGMQNSGLAASLAAATFPAYAIATVPAAVYSVWHNISGSVLANIFKNMSDKKVCEAAC